MKALYKLFLQISIFSALLFISACSDSGTNNPIIDSNEAITKEIDKVCDSVLKATPEMTGMIVGLWDADKDFTYVKGIGIADKATNKPTSADMLSRVGSISKTFTTTLALQMVDGGQLNLSDKITKYLPEYPQLSEVTVEMLCNMTSGIFDYTGDTNFTSVFVSKINEYQAPSELVKMALNYPMLSTPGTQYHYNSTNTILLAMIIEKITGKKIETLIQNNIIAPFGLVHTYFPTAKEMPTANFIHGYYMSFDFAEIAHPSWAWAAGGIISNIYDLKKWVEIVVKGNILTADLQSKRFIGLNDEDGKTYGLGISTIGNNLWGHSGTIPGYESIMMTDRTKDRTFVIFFNTFSETASPESLLKRIITIIG